MRIFLFVVFILTVVAGFFLPLGEAKWFFGFLWERVVYIPEGAPNDVVAKILGSVGVCDPWEFLRLSVDVKRWRRKFPWIPEEATSLQGFLLPGTYTMRVGMGAERALEVLLKSFEERVVRGLKVEGERLFRAVVLASIVEAETKDRDEMRVVASVFQNRLKRGMRLESCATVNYILRDKPRLSKFDVKICSPYNTYEVSGLSWAPIGNPSEHAIRAVLFPAKTDYLYFVLGPDGRHIFSRTYEGHLKAKMQSR